jgi:hypothetical protein
MILFGENKRLWLGRLVYAPLWSQHYSQDQATNGTNRPNTEVQTDFRMCNYVMNSQGMYDNLLNPTLSLPTE